MPWEIFDTYIADYAKEDGFARAASRPADVRATLTELLIRTGIPPELAASTATATIAAGYEASVLRTLRARCSAAALTRAVPSPTTAAGGGARPPVSLPARVVERVCAFAARGDAPLPGPLPGHVSAATLAVRLGVSRRLPSPLVATLRAIARGSGPAAVRAVAKSRQSPSRTPVITLAAAPPQRAVAVA